MTIHRIRRFSAFEPEHLACMRAAYEDALAALHLVSRDDPIIELVAQKIIEAARTGEHDIDRLRETALRDLAAPSSSLADYNDD